MATAKILVPLNMNGQKITNGAAGTDPTDFVIFSQLGGGTHANGQYSNTSAPDSVPTGSYTNLTWVHDSGAVSLDLTDPLNPLVLADGVYSIGAFIFGGTVGLAGTRLVAELDVNAPSYSFSPTSAVPWDDADFALLAVTAPTAFLPAGTALDLEIFHNAVGDLTIEFAAWISQIA